mmetsp:Transcript_7659/g.27793  ORF Transcript_7659/g.27793 Transcript_7659/m.27793 type:complete len:267 (-) Transcript_7659:285-1085(-)
MAQRPNAPLEWPSPKSIGVWRVAVSSSYSSNFTAWSTGEMVEYTRSRLRLHRHVSVMVQFRDFAETATLSFQGSLCRAWLAMSYSLITWFWNPATKNSPSAAKWPMYPRELPEATTMGRCFGSTVEVTLARLEDDQWPSISRRRIKLAVWDLPPWPSHATFDLRTPRRRSRSSNRRIFRSAAPARSSPSVPSPREDGPAWSDVLVSSVSASSAAIEVDGLVDPVPVLPSRSCLCLSRHSSSTNKRASYHSSSSLDALFRTGDAVVV